MNGPMTEPGPLDPVPTGVRLLDFEDALQEVVPGAKLHSSGYGLEVLFALRVTMQATRAVNDRHATETMHAYGEQIRIRAIRELGVQPILDGYRAEIEAFRTSNRTLASRLSAKQDELDVAQERLDGAMGLLASFGVDDE